MYFSHMMLRLSEWPLFLLGLWLIQLSIDLKKETFIFMIYRAVSLNTKAGIAASPQNEPEKDLSSFRTFLFSSLLFYVCFPLSLSVGQLRLLLYLHVGKHCVQQSLSVIFYDELSFGPTSKFPEKALIGPVCKRCSFPVLFERIQWAWSCCTK